MRWLDGITDPMDINLSKRQASLVAQMVKRLPAMLETWVPSLGWEDPLEEGMATHFSILDWRITMDRGTWEATVHGVTKSWTRLSDFTFQEMVDKGVLCATVYEVTKS